MNVQDKLNTDCSLSKPAAKTVIHRCVDNWARQQFAQVEKKTEKTKKEEQKF